MKTLNEVLPPTEGTLESGIRQLVSDQRSHFNSSATRPVAYRAEQLKKLKLLITQHEEELHEAIHADFGKSKYDNLVTEIYPVQHEIDIALKKLRKWARPKRVRTNLMNFPAKSYIVPEPLGVSLIIGAWNFPYNLSLIPVAASMAAGNTTILKPSEISPRTSKVMAGLINDNFDPRYLRVVEGGIPETTALLEQRYDKVFFTGSPKVGKIVNKAVAGHLTDVTLELGGKNPAIFTPDCNLEVGVKRMVWAKFLNSGQLCIAPDYILVHKDIKEKFLDQAIQEIQKHDYSVEKGNYVKIINERNFDRLVALIDPDKVYHGGGHRREDLHIAPTLLHNVTLEDDIMQDEIFGPLLPVMEYDTLDEAFDLIKGFEKPLSAYLYTNDGSTKKRFLNEIPFGGGGINESVMHNTNSSLPFGGVGNSGKGAYHGKFGFDTFSHFKAVLEKPTFMESGIKYYGHTESKMKVMRELLSGFLS